MQHEEIMRQLDQLIQSRSILGHPFYRAWQRGELSRPQLALYAASYYPHVAAFPSYLRSAIALTRSERVRTELENNLEDELSNPAPHHELWLDFAESVGADRTAVAQASSTASTTETVQSFRRLANGETAGALSALYAYESQQPGVSCTKMEGLKQFYDITSPEALAYFAVHAEKDIEHSRGERQALLACLDDGATGETILSSATDALRAYWNLLDGICTDAGIACS